MTITFEDNERFHEDLHISVPELNENICADTYFFVLDQGLLPNEETPEKVKIVLRFLLNHWLQEVESLEEGARAFLLYDFSDQYTGALKVQRQGYEVIIRLSWSTVHYSSYPTFVSQVSLKDEDFNVYIGSYTVPIEQFLEEIRRERDKIS
jgi:hypothetical protein